MNPCMCAMTSGLMNACASSPCLMSMPHVHAPCASEHAYAPCASCSMCLMHVASCVCLMHVSHACASCMASFMCLMSMPHACMCLMIVPNKCALCKKQWYIYIYISYIYINPLLFRSKSNDMKLKHTLPITAPYAQTKAQTTQTGNKKRVNSVGFQSLKLQD